MERKPTMENMEIRSGLDHGEHGELNWADHRDQILQGLQDLHGESAHDPNLYLFSMPSTVNSPCPPRWRYYDYFAGMKSPGACWWTMTMQSVVPLHESLCTVLPGWNTWPPGPSSIGLPP